MNKEVMQQEGRLALHEVWKMAEKYKKSVGGYAEDAETYHLVVAAEWLRHEGLMPVGKLTEPESERDE